ncbi:MAG: LamG-like jellyroll fold domain-containing protein [Bacteroidota bacterium]
MNIKTDYLTEQDLEFRRKRGIHIATEADKVQQGVSNKLLIVAIIMIILVVGIKFTTNAQSQIAEYCSTCVPCNSNGAGGISDTYPCYGAGGFMYTSDMMQKKWYEITWPGTHNSYANNKDGVINYVYNQLNDPRLSSENQHLSMNRQLRRGIRYLTLDVTGKDNSSRDIKLCHGACGRGLSVVNSAFDNIDRFLSDYPHDIVIVNFDFTKHRGYFEAAETPKDPGGVQYEKWYKNLFDKIKNRGLVKYIDPVKWNIMNPDNYSSSNGKVHNQVRDAWAAANINWSSMEDMIKNGERLILMPETIEDELLGNSGWLRSTGTGKYQGAGAYQPELLKLKDKKDQRTATLYVNPKTDSYSSGDKDENRKANDGRYLYNMGIWAQKKIEKLNQKRSADHSAHLTFFELQFFDSGESWRDNSDFTVVDACNWLNDDNNDPIGHLSGLGLSANVDYIFSDSYKFLNISGNQVKSEDIANTQLLISVSDPVNNYFFLREYGSRNYLYADGSSSGSKIKVDKNSNESYNKVTQWSIEKNGNSYRFKKAGTNLYMSVDNSGNAVLSTIPYNFDLRNDTKLAHFTFDNNNVTDEEGNLVSSISGSSSQYNFISTPFWGGKALNINGAQVTLNQNNAFGTTNGQISVDFWMRTHDSRTNKREIFNGKDWFIYLNDESKLAIRILGKSEKLTDLLLNDGKWHNIVVNVVSKNNFSIINKRTVTCYIDGERQFIKEIEEFGTVNFMKSLKLAAGNKWQKYTGYLDHLTIRGYELTEPKVKDNYKALSGIFASYNFENNLEDETEFENNIASTGSSPSFAYSGVEDNVCVAFNGSQSLTLPFTYSLDHFEEGSYSMMINNSVLPSGSNAAIVYSDTWALVQGTDGRLAIWSNDKGTTWFDTYINDGSWHHLLLNYKDGSMYLYLDGQYKGKANFGTINATSTISIGNGSLFSGFKGYIDEVKFYNYAQSFNDITDIMYQSDYYDRIEEGIIFSYDLDSYNSSNQLESNLGNIHLTKNSTPTIVESTAMGSGVLKLSGNESYRLTNNMSYNPVDFTNQMTVSFLFRKEPNTWTGTSEDFIGTNDWRVLIKETHFEWVIRQNNTWKIISTNNNGRNYGDGAWHLVEASLSENGNMKIFVDGKLIGSGSVISMAALDRNYGALTVGARVGGSGGFKGEMAQLQITNKSTNSESESAFLTADFIDELGLIAYYDFEDETATKPVDITDNYNNLGSFYNTVFTQNHVKPAGSETSLSFGGGAYVDLGFKMDPADFGGEMTVSLWMKTDGWNADFERVIDGDKWKLIRAGSGDNLRFYSWNSANSSTDGYTSADDGLWHHVVMTVHQEGSYQSVKRIWVDGVKEAYSYVTNPITTAVNNVLLGRNINGDTSNDFHGQIDEVKFYSRLLSDDEIISAYNLEYQTDELAYYKLDGDANDDYGYFHGTATSVQFQTDAERGTVAKFGGSGSYIALDKLSSNSAITTLEGTVSGWFKATSESILFFAGESNSNGYGGDNDLHVHVSSDGKLNGSINGTESFTVSSTSTVFDGEWHYMVFTWEENAINLLLDGELNEVSFEADFDYSLNNFYLGRMGDYTRAFDGYLDDVKVYNYAVDLEGLSNDYNQLIAQYKLDGNANDESGNYNGTGINGINLNYLDSERGTVASFDGNNDYIDLPDMTIDLTEGFSFTGWLYWNGINNHERVFDFGNGDGQNDIFLTRNGTSNKLTLAVYKDGSRVLVEDADFIEPNDWIHVGVTIDANGSAVIYKNGQVAATGNVNLPIGNITRVNNRLGRVQSDNYNSFNGKMDEVKFYNSALSQNEITDSFLESPWKQTVLGSPAIEGVAWSKDGYFNVEVAGSDIWGTSDEGHFVYQSWSGDGEMIAKVSSMENINEWSKTGLMFRETLDANSKYADIVVTPSNGVSFQRRTSTGGSSYHEKVTGLNTPIWLKMKRVGDAFTAYYSFDGSSWTQVGSSRTVSMTGDLYVGLVATSHDVSQTGVSTFTNVSISSSTSARVAQAEVEEEIVGEENEPEINEVTIYPNPASDVLNISATGDSYNFQMIDMNGKTVHRASGLEGSTQLSVTNFQRGIYILRISDKEKTRIFKVVVGN